MTVLKPLHPEFVDGENNAIILDAAYALRDGVDLSETIRAVLDTHGGNTLFLPMSARSGGGGIFQVSPPSGSVVVGLSVESAVFPNVSIRDETEISELGLNDIVVCPTRSEILAGAAITLDQLNRTLSETAGAGHMVLGADLTSHTYAQVGSTFMTGGMGPQRRYFSDSVTEVTLFDGAQTLTLQGEELLAYAGTYGWTGLVTAVRCRYLRLPDREVTFALPVHSDSASLAGLLERLSPWCFLEESEERMINQHGGDDLILGIEHVTLDSMEPMLCQGGDSPLKRRARALASRCRDANCDGLVFINGCTKEDTDSFLMNLVDDLNSDHPSIGGIDLENSEVFNDPDEMRALREGIPFAARTQAPQGRFVFKGHTDATIRLDRNDISGTMKSLWDINCKYVGRMLEYFDNSPDVDGQMLIYGHMNPWGVDPHNRLTLACDSRDVYKEAVHFNRSCMEMLYQELSRACDGSLASFVGGEKGAGSEREILSAFDEETPPPTTLSEKFEHQKRAIRHARTQFNWRALPPYSESTMK